MGKICLLPLQVKNFSRGESGRMGNQERKLEINLMQRLLLTDILMIYCLITLDQPIYAIGTSTLFNLKSHLT